jgi:general secretion pathway protein H
VNTRRSHGGFTLLELLAVLVILALVAAFVVPSLGRGTGTELKAATRTLAAALRQVRSDAVNRNRPAVLSLDVDKREFRLPGEARIHKLPEGVDLKLFTARSELESEQRGAIRFFPDGSSTGGRITLANDAGRYLVDVDWLTGRVRVIDAAEEQVASR